MQCNSFIKVSPNIRNVHAHISVSLKFSKSIGIQYITWQPWHVQPMNMNCMRVCVALTWPLTYIASFHISLSHNKFSYENFTKLWKISFQNLSTISTNVTCTCIVLFYSYPEPRSVNKCYTFWSSASLYTLLLIYVTCIINHTVQVPTGLITVTLYTNDSQIYTFI